MELVIKEIHGDEITVFYEILVRCGIEMHAKYNLNHWYPFMDEVTFRNSLVDKKLYGVYKSGVPIATFNITTNARDYYSESIWNISANKALYLGQLATDPVQQCNGIGKWCMAHVERIATELNCEAIRFDGLASHPWLKNFYTKLGYIPVSIVKPGAWDLQCFEKRV